MNGSSLIEENWWGQRDVKHSVKNKKQNKQNAIIGEVRKREKK